MDKPKNKRIRYAMKARKVLEFDEKSEANHGSTSLTDDMYDTYSSASSTCSDDEVYDQSLYWSLM